MLTIKEVHSYYGKTEILKGISLEVNEREIVTIVGANGAGKTTTLRTISGLINKSEGEIEFLGKPISALPPDVIVRSGISHVQQGGGLFPDMTVRENLELGSCTRTEKSEIADDLKNVYELFPILKERTEQISGTLSGGERQMLAIGRGLMARPKIFLLDEPSLGLSPLMVKEVGSIIAEINKNGLTVLLVEQNTRMALGVADRGYVLDTGEITLEGKASELMNNEHLKKAYLGK